MLQIYYIVRYTNNAGNTATERDSLLSQTYKPRRYAGSNKGTPAPLRTMQPEHESILNKKTAPLLVRSSIATTPCRNMCSNLQTHIMRQARIEVTAAYALNYLKLRVLKLILAYRFLSANMMALIGTVLYNAIKEYYDDGTRKIIYFYSHTVEEDYNRAGKREDNILTVDECRTGYSNEEDIEADKREEETRVRLRKLSREIHDILLREFRGANDFTESVTHNDDEQLEDCDALVERYEEEINCSDLYSTV
ncbi:hypothetical protein HBI94_247880 [Parastagonospora nodorum]|nr:hypothetical protein HBI94_247880 [Parastagonospora nodorum]